LHACVLFHWLKNSCQKCWNVFPFPRYIDHQWNNVQFFFFISFYKPLPLDYADLFYLMVTVYRVRMVVGFTTTYVISAYHHWCCEFESLSGRDVQHYVIKFISDLRQVDGLYRQTYWLEVLRCVSIPKIYRPPVKQRPIFLSINPFPSTMQTYFI
jgi:hypothetical protein